LQLLHESRVADILRFKEVGLALQLFDARIVQAICRIVVREELEWLATDQALGESGARVPRAMARSVITRVWCDWRRKSAEWSCRTTSRRAARSSTE
jgi:hypothetical protein